MIQDPVEFIVKGQKYTVKSPSEDEVQDIMQLMVEVAGSSPYILGTPESFRKKTVENQIKWIQNTAVSSSAVILSLYQDGQMKGLADASSFQDIKRKHRASLGISLHPDVRGKGLGTPFMKILIDSMKRFDGIKIIELDVMTNNKVAVKLYENLGFKNGGLFPNAYILPSGEVSDNLRMYLEV